jgi:hypothetical protein
MLKAALSTRPATKKQSSNNRSLHFVLMSVVKREALGAPFAPASGVSLPESGMLTEVEISDKSPKSVFPEIAYIQLKSYRDLDFNEVEINFSVKTKRRRVAKRRESKGNK